MVQGELAIVCRLIQLLLWARRSLDIYNNLRQVKQMHFKYTHACAHTAAIITFTNAEFEPIVWHLRENVVVLSNVAAIKSTGKRFFFNVLVVFHNTQDQSV